MKNVVVINNEAHHCYRERPGGEDEEKPTAEEREEAKENNEAARLWISGLEALKRKVGVRAVYDLSATPFFLRGSGYREGTLFPWTVSDFSLMDAIECGIVKLPRVPVSDNLPIGDMPVYRELWKHIGKKMPKKGVGKGGPVDPLSLPEQLQTALAALYGHYETTHEAWKRAGIPPTVTQATVRADRLRSMRSRLSAAYKGVNALLMKTGARDFRSGQEFDNAVFYEESVDIHHIFPRDWCRKQAPKIDKTYCDSIVNKTPLSARTNRIIGGVAPSVYLGRLEAGGSKAPPIAPDALDGHLSSHLITPGAIRIDDFMAFFRQRQEALLSLIEAATGRPAYRDTATDEPLEDVGDDEDDAEPDIDDSDAGAVS